MQLLPFRMISHRGQKEKLTLETEFESPISLGDAKTRCSAPLFGFNALFSLVIECPSMVWYIFKMKGGSLTLHEKYEDISNFAILPTIKECLLLLAPSAWLG